MGSKKSDIAAFSAKAELEAESSARAPSGESEKSRRALRGHIARIKRAGVSIAKCQIVPCMRRNEKGRRNNQ